MLRPFSRLVVMFCTSLVFAACAGTIDKLHNIGVPPSLSPIAVPPNMAAGAPVYIPQPPPPPAAREPNALWRQGSRSFFRDPQGGEDRRHSHREYRHWRPGQDRQHDKPLDRRIGERRPAEFPWLGKPASRHLAR